MNYPGIQTPPDRVRIVRLIIAEVLGYHNQYLRPYQADTSSDVISSIIEQTKQPGNFSPSLINQSASRFISPSSVPGSVVQIVNGWNEKRFRFMMEVAFNTGFGESTEIVCGFTDYPGIYNNHLDPNMLFYINTVVPMKKVTMVGNQGSYVQITPQSPSHLLAKSNYENHQPLYNLTPMVVLNKLVTNAYDFEGEIFDVTSDVNYTSLSVRDNANPGRFSSKILTAYKDTVINTNNSMASASPKEMLSNTRSSLHEPIAVHREKFLNLVMNITGDRQSTLFRFRDLMAMDPNVSSDQITQVIMKDLSKVVPVEYTQHLGGADINTQTTINIANILPTIMMDYGIVTLHLESTNNVFGGQIQTFITHIQTLSGTQLDMSPYLPTITNRINQELMTAVSMGNQVSYDASIQCQITGDTFIQLGYNGEPKVPFIVPTFADGLFNPIITDKSTDVDNLAQSFNGVFSVIESNVPQARNIDYNHIGAIPSTVINDL